MESSSTRLDSKFRYVLLVAKRAEQLMQGALPRVESRHSKPTRIAMREVAEEKVNWEIPIAHE